MRPARAFLPLPLLLRPHDDPRGGFTLVELLVVIVIIALISVAALPVVLPALNERRVSEAARIFQAQLAGARDAAIRANAPRGIRLLPDPVFNGPQVLASNRFIPIEPAPNYSEGLVSAGLPFPTTTNGFLSVVQVTTTIVSGVTVPTTPTGWAHNIRQGDKIQFNNSGAIYTIAGPTYTGPAYNKNKPGNYLLNSERFINLDQPAGYPAPPMASAPTNAKFEYLFLVNGYDDDGDGWVDEGFDGIDNDGDGVIDPGFNGLDDNGDGNIDEAAELTYGNESEIEAFLGTQSTSLVVATPYTIYRRPVISPGTREVTLPEGIVIDMTTWNASSSLPSGVAFGTSPFNYPIQLPERSRVPVDPYTNYVDILIAPSGQVVQAGPGSSASASGSLTPSSNLPFYHFWLTDRQGVVAPLWDPPSPATPYAPTRNPNYNATTPQPYLLPMPKGTPNYLPMPASPSGGPNYSNSPAFLTGERRLVTLFTRTGQIVTNSIEVFNPYDVSQPFYNAQAGVKEQQ